MRLPEGVLAGLVACGWLLAHCGSSKGGAGDDCVPAPGSCDAPAPQMNPFDPARGCLAAPVALHAVCDTSVNRCDPSAGIGPVCAVAPDGGVFVAVMTDNDMLTAQGWRFAQPLESFPNSGAIPADEHDLPTDDEACAKAECAPPCAGVAPLFAIGAFCHVDAGDAADDSRD